MACKYVNLKNKNMTKGIIPNKVQTSPEIELLVLVDT